MPYATVSTTNSQVCDIKVSPAASVSTTPGPLTAAELTEISRTDLAHVFDTKGGATTDGAGKIVTFSGRKVIGGIPNALTPDVTTGAPAKVSATDGKPMILCGVNPASSTNYGGEFNGALIGDDNCRMPGYHTTLASLGAPTISSGALTAVPLVSGGTGYQTGAGVQAPPLVVFSGVPGGGTAPTAHATTAAGVITGIVVDTPGSGLDSGLTVRLVSQIAPFTLSILAAFAGISTVAPAASGVLFAMGDGFKNFTFEQGGASLRTYSNKTGTSGSAIAITVGAGTDLDTALHPFHIVWDGSTLFVYRGTTLLASAAAALSGYTSRRFRVGSGISAAGAVVTRLEGLWERLAVFSGTDAAARAAFNAVCAERHPGLSLT